MKGFITKTLIVFTVLYLEQFLHFVNMNMLIYLPLEAGISVNLKDMLIIGFLVYFSFSKQKDRVSPQLKLLLLYLGFCLFAVTLMSVFAYGASLGVIGNRLRYYFNYALILGLIMLVDGDENFRFLVYLVFGIGLLACCIHFVEYMRGTPFHIAGGGVTTKYFSEGGGAGSFMGITRIWNRAPSNTMLMFVISASFLVSNIGKKLLFILPFFFSLASIALSLTRTMYVFVALTLFTIFLTNILYKKGKPLFFGFIVLFIGLVAVLYTITNNPGLLRAMSGRFQNIVEIFTKGKAVETMTARQQQYEFLKKKMVEADIPPFFGIGITNETAQYMTSDLGFMNIIINMGLAGILFIFLLFIYLYSKSVFLMKNADDDLYRLIGMSIFCMLPGLLLIGYNFDYITGRQFLLLALPVLLLESGDYVMRLQFESKTTGLNDVSSRSISAEGTIHKNA